MKFFSIQHSRRKHEIFKMSCQISIPEWKITRLIQIQCARRSVGKLKLFPILARARFLTELFSFSSFICAGQCTNCCSISAQSSMWSTPLDNIRKSLEITSTMSERWEWNMKDPCIMRERQNIANAKKFISSLGVDIIERQQRRSFVVEWMECGVVKWRKKNKREF